ncbi:D-ribose pyranase [Devosia sp. UYZn731]|uniref:D-ribose pyranase n=1 Tax=Devosia sp. UYZn731 TaxID=3156345 RepID=UPI0033954EE0
MKRAGILNVGLAEAIVSIGHGDILMIVDAGYPVPAATWQIDLSIVAGVPDLKTVYAAVAPELIVEKVHFAHEVKLHNHPMYAALRQWFDERDFESVDHARIIGEMGARAKVIVRTGALDPWGNIALVGGVDYRAYFSDPAIDVPDNFRKLIDRSTFIPGAHHD